MVYEKVRQISWHQNAWGWIEIVHHYRPVLSSHFFALSPGSRFRDTALVAFLLPVHRTQWVRPSRNRHSYSRPYLVLAAASFRAFHIDIARPDPEINPSQVILSPVKIDKPGRPVTVELLQPLTPIDALGIHPCRRRSRTRDRWAGGSFWREDSA